MNTLPAAKDLPYWLWGAVLLLSACLYVLAPGLHRDGILAHAAPGFTVTEPHVGPVRVIPLANAALISPCAVQEEVILPPEGQALAEL